MHPSFRRCLPLALLVLAACSPKPDEQSAVPAPDAISAPAPATVAVAPQEERKCSDDPQPGEEGKLPRCVGVAAVPPPPRAFHIASEGGQCVIEGDACTLEKPFKLSGCGIKDYYTFTPASAGAGSFTYQGNMMGARVSGGGGYTVDVGESGGTIQTAASRNCAGAGGVAGCNGINIRFKLTPIAACGAAP
ncbi:hypothetical protein [Thermomonas sp. HDW16]|uniref:hypothetical protein n=1 Tax=Thermomonas sp. HDW16 TaxID=2714945 RepID=UPI001408D9F7|nr:hypothetical protein [Thermomonas sp. HDW16]QIL19368.1 hypothetical protein G7079_00680 [Thermomonas sp. HDW16]